MYIETYMYIYAHMYKYYLHTHTYALPLPQLFSHAGAACYGRKCAMLHVRTMRRCTYLFMNMYVCNYMNM